MNKAVDMMSMFGTTGS